jgi:ATP-dependent DNA helicase RecQ
MLLSRSGYIDYMEEQDSAARVHFLTGRNELYRLEGNTPDEDRVIVAMLRLYGGIFADYGYIDESLVAREAGLTSIQTYEVLKSLSLKRIISFIPRKRTPYIRYMQRREEREYIVIPHAVYEEQRQRFQERIDAMLRYMNTDNQCRSRQLLRYFGETNTHDCGHCDVCRS